MVNFEIEVALTAKGHVEGAAGFEGNQKIRRAVEKHAMKVVERHYLRLGYTVESKHKTESYDFECSKKGQRRLVEVKGTRTAGDQVLLTANEVKLADRNDVNVDLCVVHSIQMNERREITCRGGKLVQYQDWHPRDHRLRPVSFICELTEP